MFDLKPRERLLKIHYYWEDFDNPRGGNWWVAVSHIVPVGNEEDALLECFREYYANVPAEQEERIRGYGPNWGDAWHDVPDDHLLKHGFRFLDLPSPDRELGVCHDDLVYDFDEEDE